MAPKVAGAWNLHIGTLEDPIDSFVLFSSAASVLGWPGQSTYAAGNAYLDGLARFRHAHSLPALAINWGPWAEFGMAARTIAATSLRFEDFGLGGPGARQRDVLTKRLVEQIGVL